MLSVRNKQDLRIAYEMILLVENEMKENPSVDKEKCFEIIRKYKKDIREYYKQGNKDSILNGMLVKDYGIDGYIEKVTLPPVSDMDKAKEYFENNLYMEYYPSAYDCTGQCFTSWYRIYKNSQNRYICYHRVSVDC